MARLLLLVDPYDKENSMNLIIEHLSKRFERKRFCGISSFTFSDGKIYACWRNGAGKTTLFTA